MTTSDNHKELINRVRSATVEVVTSADDLREATHALVSHENDPDAHGGRLQSSYLNDKIRDAVYDAANKLIPGLVRASLGDEAYDRIEKEYIKIITETVTTIVHQEVINNDIFITEFLEKAESGVESIADGRISIHNLSGTSHLDIREAISTAVTNLLEADENIKKIAERLPESTKDDVRQTVEVDDEGNYVLTNPVWKEGENLTTGYAIKPEDNRKRFIVVADGTFTLPNISSVPKGYWVEILSHGSYTITFTSPTAMYRSGNWTGATSQAVVLKAGMSIRWMNNNGSNWVALYDGADPKFNTVGSSGNSVSNTGFRISNGQDVGAILTSWVSTNFPTRSEAITAAASTTVDVNKTPRTNTYRTSFSLVKSGVTALFTETRTWYYAATDCGSGGGSDGSSGGNN